MAVIICVRCVYQPPGAGPYHIYFWLATAHLAVLWQQCSQHLFAVVFWSSLTITGTCNALLVKAISVA
jgi:hypothetical protein